MLDLDLARAPPPRGRASRSQLLGGRLAHGDRPVCETPRIITPSSTACPPTGASRCAFSSPSASSCGRRDWSRRLAERGAVAATAATARCSTGVAGEPPAAAADIGYCADGSARVQAALGDAALEALDASTGVDQLLAARVERMAVRADLDVQLVAGGAGDELVAAGAAHVRLHVVGMDLCLHRHPILATGRGA